MRVPARYTQMPHIDCHHTPAFEFNSRGALESTKSKPGDLRICEHGKVMQCIHIGYEGIFMVDLETPVWRTISPIWNPISYREAKRELAHGPSD